MGWAGVSVGGPDGVVVDVGMAVFVGVSVMVGVGVGLKVRLGEGVSVIVGRGVSVFESTCVGIGVFVAFSLTAINFGYARRMKTTARISKTRMIKLLNKIWRRFVSGLV
jgi:hypothetical protein